MKNTLVAGAASKDISPVDSQFLFGYPHVERYSTGVHDPLLSAALYLFDGRTAIMFISNDIIFFIKSSVQRIRDRIEQALGLPGANVMITATHTHSGPIIVNCISNEADATVPNADPEYVSFLEDQVVTSARAAHKNACPAQLGFALADSTGVGTNRRDPRGPADHKVPVLIVRTADGAKNIAAMMVVSMHPTVLHEDSTLVSADFPGMARAFLRENVLGETCPLLYHSGPCGNQSPRHVTRANTFEEANRLGAILGTAVEKAIPGICTTSEVSLRCAREFLDLPRKTFPTVVEAEAKLDKAVLRLQELRQTNAPHQEARTAECDWFGAEETLVLAKAARDGRLEKAYTSCLPAEIQIIEVGPWCFVGWPAEVFVEYGLAVKARKERACVISLANGELQGYIVTPEAAAEGGYEASNGLFGPECGRMLVNKTLDMLAEF